MFFFRKFPIIPLLQRVNVRLSTIRGSRFFDLVKRKIPTIQIFLFFFTLRQTLSVQ